LDIPLDTNKHAESVRQMAKGHFSEGHWQGAATGYEEVLSLVPLTSIDRLEYGIALANTQKYSAATDMLAEADLASSVHRSLIRRVAIMPAIRAGNLDLAKLLLLRVKEAKPDDLINLDTLATVYLRAGERGKAVPVLEYICQRSQSDMRAKNQLIAAYIKLAKLSQAADFAAGNASFWPQSMRLARLSAIAFHREGRRQEAVKVAIVILSSSTLELNASQIAAQIFLDTGDFAKTIRICERAFEHDLDNARLRYLMAVALIELHGDSEEAIRHLEQSLEQDPKTRNSLSLLGKLLMGQGRFQSAVQYLRRIVDLAPEAPGAWYRLGVALKLAGRIDDAADIFLRALKYNDKSAGWARMTMSTLIQSGRKAEAEKLFEDYMTLKRGNLMESLELGLENLMNGVDSVSIPQSRLNWMWEFTRATDPSRSDVNRVEWEDKVRWGSLANQLIQDWLEVNSDRADEVQRLFGDMEPQKEFLKSIKPDGEGLILVSAHIGPLFVGPLMLSSFGIEHKWVAFIPRISSVSYVENLISTGDQTGLQVVGAIDKALSDGLAVIIAVDGVSNPSTPSVEFEGKNIPHSDIGARMSFRRNLPSVFVGPFWRERNIDLFLCNLPMAAEDESRGEFISRWNEAYFNAVREYTKLGPENLGTPGGMWG
jgi:tetratricopeptide (TPR) repeat protein